ncbi:hypothetical protein HaLaN_29673, partial [Haematococcus lacustris]
MIRGHFPAALVSAFLLFGCSSAAVWEEVCATAARSIDSNCGPELKFAMARLNMSTDSVSWVRYSSLLTTPTTHKPTNPTPPPHKLKVAKQPNDRLRKQFKPSEAAASSAQQPPRCW